MNKAELIKALTEMLAEKMQLGEEPTNGEVIKALFPNALVYEEMEECETLVHIVWDYKDDRNYSYIKKFWWNEPYKAEKGGE